MTARRLLPFTVPAFVMVDAPAPEGCLTVIPVPLQELDAATLAALCDRWRAAVFARAGLADPETGQAVEHA